MKDSIRDFTNGRNVSQMKSTLLNEETDDFEDRTEAVSIFFAAIMFALPFIFAIL